MTITAAKHVATRSILNPLLWLCAIVSAPAAVSATFASQPLLTILLILAILPPSFALLAYAYWTFKEPNRLQSEHFVLQQQWIQSQAQIGDNRTHEVIDVPVNQSILTSNKMFEDTLDG